MKFKQPTKTQNEIPLQFFCLRDNFT